MCRELESQLMDDDDDEMVVRVARKFVHNGVKARKPVDTKPVMHVEHNEEDMFEEEFIREVS